MLYVKTPQRIIQSAIGLFNDQGVPSVSLRSIAAELGISPGNLAYHFRNKGEIITAIADMMDQERPSLWAGESAPDFEDLNNYLLLQDEYQKRHRFFFRDMVEVFRLCPDLGQSHRVMLAGEEAAFLRMLREWEKSGLLIPEPAEDCYTDLFWSSWMQWSFRYNQEKILGTGHPAIRAGGPVRKVWRVILPYLTSEGRESYASLSPHPDWL